MLGTPASRACRLCTPPVNTLRLHISCFSTQPDRCTCIVIQGAMFCVASHITLQYLLLYLRWYRLVSPVRVCVLRNEQSIAD